MLVRKVEYLIALAREEHYARAAAACRVSQPTLSAGIKQLEVELGVPIVKRGQRFSGLTPEGERVLSWAHRMAAECERLHRELDELGGDAPGIVHVGVIPSALPLMPLLTEPFQRQHPKANLKISSLNAFEIHRGLEEFSIDVAITYVDDKVHEARRTSRLYSEDYVLLARKGQGLAGRRSVTWEEAARLPLCVLSQEMLCPRVALADLLRRPAYDAAIIETNSITALYAHLQAGARASVLPASLVLPAFAELFDVLPLPHDGTPDIVGVVISERTPTPLAQAFFTIATSAGVAGALHDTLRLQGAA